MQPANNTAFKEWAVVCAALGNRRQTIILRKGGIDEGREGFRVKHKEFWLLPTRFHQAAGALVPDAEPLWRDPTDRLADRVSERRRYRPRRGDGPNMVSPSIAPDRAFTAPPTARTAF